MKVYRFGFFPRTGHTQIPKGAYSMIESSLLQHANGVAKECDDYSGRLHDAMRRIATRQKVIRGLGVVSGVAAVIVSFIPPFSDLVPDQWSKGISGLAAALLIADAIWPNVFSDSAARYRDYAYYIGLWAQKIRDTQVEPGLEDEVRAAKLAVLADLAALNVQAVKSRWEGSLPPAP